MRCLSPALFAVFAIFQLGNALDGFNSLTDFTKALKQMRGQLQRKTDASVKTNEILDIRSPAPHAPLFEKMRTAIQSVLPLVKSSRQLQSNELEPSAPDARAELEIQSTIPETILPSQYTIEDQPSDVTGGSCSNLGKMQIKTAEECVEATEYLKLKVGTMSGFTRTNIPGGCVYEIDNQDVDFNENIEETSTNSDRRLICKVLPSGNQGPTFHWTLSPLNNGNCTEACAVYGAECREEAFQSIDREEMTSAIQHLGLQCSSFNGWNYNQGPSICTNECCNTLNGCLHACSLPSKKGSASMTYLQRLTKAETCDRLIELTLEQCIEAIATFHSEAVLDNPSGASYGPQWPKGCFMRYDGVYFFNIDGTDGTPSSDGRRICRDSGGDGLGTCAMNSDPWNCLNHHQRLCPCTPYSTTTTTISTTTGRVGFDEYVRGDEKTVGGTSAAAPPAPPPPAPRPPPPPPPSSPHDPCDAGWALGNSLCYGVPSGIHISGVGTYKGYGTYSEAYRYCEALGATPAKITNEEQNNIVKSFATLHSNQENTNVRADVAWIGLTDKAFEGEFEWVDGDRVTYAKWKDGEPNDDNGYGRTKGQDCATIMLATPQHKREGIDGFWEDTKCSATWPAIVCSKKSRGTTTTTTESCKYWAAAKATRMQDQSECPLRGTFRCNDNEETPSDALFIDCDTWVFGGWRPNPSNGLPLFKMRSFNISHLGARYAIARKETEYELIVEVYQTESRTVVYVPEKNEIAVEWQQVGAGGTQWRTEKVESETLAIRDCQLPDFAKRLEDKEWTHSNCGESRYSSTPGLTVANWKNSINEQVPRIPVNREGAVRNEKMYDYYKVDDIVSGTCIKPTTAAPTIKRQQDKAASADDLRGTGSSSSSTYSADEARGTGSSSSGTYSADDARGTGSSSRPSSSTYSAATTSPRSGPTVQDLEFSFGLDSIGAGSMTPSQMLANKTFLSGLAEAIAYAWSKNYNNIQFSARDIQVDSIEVSRRRMLEAAAKDVIPSPELAVNFEDLQVPRRLSVKTIKVKYSIILDRKGGEKWFQENANFFEKPENMQIKEEFVVAFQEKFKEKAAVEVQYVKSIEGPSRSSVAARVTDKWGQVQLVPRGSFALIDGGGYSTGDASNFVAEVKNPDPGQAIGEIQCCKDASICTRSSTKRSVKESGTYSASGSDCLSGDRYDGDTTKYTLQEAIDKCASLGERWGLCRRSWIETHDICLAHGCGIDSATVWALEDSFLGSPGSPACPCIGELPSKVVNELVYCSYEWAYHGQCVKTLGLNTTMPLYPGDYGEECKVHKEPGQEACYDQSKKPPVEHPINAQADWCKKEWCYVDPCNCDEADPTKSDYFPGELTYSYATCGDEDTYTSTQASLNFAAHAAGSGNAACADQMSKVDWQDKYKSEPNFLSGRCEGICGDLPDALGSLADLPLRSDLEEQHEANLDGVCAREAVFECAAKTPECLDDKEMPELGVVFHMVPCLCACPALLKHGGCKEPEAGLACMLRSPKCEGYLEILKEKESFNSAEEVAKVQDRCAEEAERENRRTGGSGMPDCPCLKSLPNWVEKNLKFDCSYEWAHNGKCVQAQLLDYPLNMYPGNYGVMCKVHEEPGQSDCYDLTKSPPVKLLVDDQAKWCNDKWCYVDPCNCRATDATKSDYFNQNNVPSQSESAGVSYSYSIKKSNQIAYSYSTCGNKNRYIQSEVAFQALGSGKCLTDDLGITSKACSDKCAAVPNVLISLAEEDPNWESICSNEATFRCVDNFRECSTGDSNDMFWEMVECSCDCPMLRKESQKCTETQVTEKLKCVFESSKCEGFLKVYKEMKGFKQMEMAKHFLELNERENCKKSRYYTEHRPRGVSGSPTCPCLGSLPSSLIKDVACDYEFSFHGKCVEIPNAAKVKLRFKMYPADYGESCMIHAEPGQADCYKPSPTHPDAEPIPKCHRRLEHKPGHYCHAQGCRNFTERLQEDAVWTVKECAPWCNEPWCFVDPCKCDTGDVTQSDYFDPSMLQYSYATCGGTNNYVEETSSANSVGNAVCSMQSTLGKGGSRSKEQVPPDDALKEDLRAQLRARESATKDGATMDGANSRSSSAAVLAACLMISLSLPRWSFV